MHYDATNGRQLYADLFETGASLYEEVASNLDMGAAGDLAVLNNLQWSRSEIVELPANEASRLGASMTQEASSGGIYVAVNAGGAAASPVSEIAAQVSPVSITEKDEGVYILESQKVKVTIIGGEITSFIDLDIQRELIPSGERGNRLVIFYDQAMTFWDALDVEVYHLEQPSYLGLGTVKILESGPLRASLEVFHKISNESWIKSTISLDAYCHPVSSATNIQSLLHISCEVEWNENRRFLKVEFPWNIHSNFATYETQFGAVRSPTHYNTSWDYAKFEVVCHRFADLSEHGYGVSILNDCKYGFETQGNVQRLSLLRSPKGPDPTADMGRQRFRYAVAPHAGSFNEAAVTRAGIDFNKAVRVVRVSDVEKLNGLLSCIRLEGPANVFLDTVKRGEDDEDLDGHYKLKSRVGKSIIVRVYEGLGGSTQFTIKV